MGDLDRDGRLKSVPTGGTGRHFTAQFGHRFGVGVRVQVDADPDCGKAGVPGCEAEEAAQVDPRACGCGCGCNSCASHVSQEELTAWNNLFLPITQGA